MSSSIDAVFADLAADDPGDVLAFYDVEGQVLDLWDQLNELMLEEALLGARITTLSGKDFGLVPVGY